MTTDTAFRFDPVGAVVFGGVLGKGHVPLHDEAFEFVGEDEPVLRTPAEPIDFKDTSFDPINTGLKLAETMLRRGGVGIAAPQVGISKRMVVLRANPLIIAVNPAIIDVGNGEVTDKANVEGCLSFPGLAVKVKRYKFVRVRYHLPNGEVKTESFTGLSAATWQHEIDHLDGILFFDRAGKYHRDQAFRQRKRRLG